MKSLQVLFVFFIFFFGQSSAQNFFKLNTNPENPGRMPNPKTEIGIILSQDSPPIQIGNGNGGKSWGRLYAGTLVIADNLSFYATWVAICGNTIYTPWKPVGKVIYFKNPGDYENACLDMIVLLGNKMDKLQTGVDQLLARDYTGTLIELRQMIKNLQPHDANPSKLELGNSGWTWWKTASVAGAALVGAGVGGLVFPATENKYEILPGDSHRAGNGTIIWGPSVTREWQEKKFNVLGAITGALIGGGLTYLLLQ